MGSGSNQWYPQAAMSSVPSCAADASRSATQTSERGEMLLRLSPNAQCQTPVLLKGGHG